MNKKELSPVSFSVKHGAHVLYSEICKASERNTSKPHSGHLKFAPRRILQRSVFSRKKKNQQVETDKSFCAELQSLHSHCVVHGKS